MRPLFTVSTQSRNLGQIQVEALDEPVDGISRSVGEDLDEIVTSQFSRRLLGIGKAGISAARRKKVAGVGGEDLQFGSSIRNTSVLYV